MIINPSNFMLLFWSFGSINIIFPWNHVITITAIFQLYYPPILLYLWSYCIVQNLKVHVLIGSFISNPNSASFTVSLVKTNY